MSLIVTSPFKGWVSALESVPDPVFAERMLGDGVAIQPLGDVVIAPFDGEVITLHESAHAVVLRSAEGAEVLIHIGLDTVALKGKGFTPLVAPGARVARGDALIRFDIDAVALAATSLTTPVIVTNGDAFTIRRRTVDSAIGAGDELMTLVPVASAQPAREADGGAVAEQVVTLTLPHGLHARPAARIGACARQFGADVHLIKGDKRGDARSTVALLSLGTAFGDRITVRASGADADAALAAIVELLGSDMGETAPSPAAAPVRATAALKPGRLAGVIASPGLAAGPIVRLRRREIAVAEQGNGAAAERAALRVARDTLRGQVAIRAQAGGTLAAVMQAHLALIDDPALLTAADARIAAGTSAGMAWRAAIRDQIDAIRATGNAHLIERTDDLSDIERQVLAILAGTSVEAEALPPGAIVVADDVLPSQLVALAAGKPAGIALANGGPTSHVAILCAGLGLPALVAMGGALAAIADGTMVLLDAEAGHLTVAPSPDDAEQFAARLARRATQRDAARAAAHDVCSTADGVRIEVFANLGSVADAKAAAAQGAEGSGLVRSEFLFLDRADAPSQDEQLAAYQGIADALPGKPIIVRLLDVGGDKPAAYIPIAPEENPALGLRGVRVVLAQPALLETQLRAILRVQPVGQCRIMVPMIASVAELRAVRAMVERLRADMRIATPVEVGVMVETPAAAMTADLLAAEADFLSIGTNDLTQYVLAMDRGNPAVAAEVDAMHPAVLRMIAETCRLATAGGRWVGVCGGLASDPAALPILIGLGATEVSVVPGFVAEAKQIVRGLTLERARTHAQRALLCTSASEVRSLAREFGETLS